MVTVYTGSEAEMSMMLGYEYRELLVDVVSCFLGYLAWRDYTNFYVTERSALLWTWTGIHVRYEVMYYIMRLIVDLEQWFHHVLSLGFLYFAWPCQAGISMTLFIFGLSNPALSLVQKHETKLTKIGFAISFFMARIVGGTWLMKKLYDAPTNGVSTHVVYPLVPIVGSLYLMQWWWLIKIYSLASSNKFSL
jgi:hypothetical protein